MMPDDATRSRRLAIWSIAAAAYFSMIVARTGPSIAADQIAAAFALPAIALGALFGVQYFIYMLLQLPSGALADSVGPRWMFGAGALLGGAGTLLFATTHSYHLAVAGRAMVGVGDAFIYLNGLRLIGNWFRPYEFATWAGLLGLAGGFGGILATAPLAALLTHVSWRVVFAWLGVSLAAVAAACFMALRSSPAAAQPEHRHRSLRQTLPSPRASVRGLVSVARNPRQWPAVAAHTAMVGPSVAFFGVWAVPMLLQLYGFSRFQAGIFLMLSALGGLIGGPAIALASDRLGRRRPFLIGTVVASAAGWISVALMGGHPPLVVLFLAATAASIGSTSTVLAFAIAREVNPPELTGIASGLVNVGGYLCGALLQIVMGRALDSHWEGLIVGGTRIYTAGGFANAFFWVAAVAVVAGALALRVPETGRAARVASAP